MRALIVGQNGGSYTGKYERIHPFGYRSPEEITRAKLIGAGVVVVLPVLFNLVVGLI